MSKEISSLELSKAIARLTSLGRHEPTGWGPHADAVKKVIAQAEAQPDAAFSVVSNLLQHIAKRWSIELAARLLRAIGSYAGNPQFDTNAACVRYREFLPSLWAEFLQNRLPSSTSTGFHLACKGFSRSYNVLITATETHMRQANLSV